MSIYIIPAIWIVLLCIWFTAKNPFVGLILLILVNPLEALFSLPGGLSVGRLVAALAIIGWFTQLTSNRGSAMRLRQSRLLSTIWIFPACCIFSSLLSPYALEDAAGFSDTIKILLLVLLSLMIENLVVTRRQFSLFLLVIAVSSLIGSVFPVAYHFGMDLYTPLGYDPLETVYGGRAQGLTSNPNGLAMAANTGLFALIIFFSSGKHRVRIYLSLIAMGSVIVGALVLSASRTYLVVLFAFGLALVSLRLIGPRKGRLGALIGALFLGAIVFGAYQFAPEGVRNRVVMVGDNVDRSTLRRAEFTNRQLRQAIDAVASYPLLGIGPGNFRFIDGYDAHNSFSSIVGETGILGTYAFLLLLVTAGRRIYRGIKSGLKNQRPNLYLYSIGFMATLAAMLVAMFGGYVIIYRRWFWITIGVSAIIARWCEQSELQLDPNAVTVNPQIPGHRPLMEADQVHSRSRLRSGTASRI